MHLPVSLPDVRLRPRLLNEDQLLPDADEVWAALTAVATSLPSSVLHSHGATPTVGLPLADSEGQPRIDR